jgi:hypothetical protein
MIPRTYKQLFQTSQDKAAPPAEKWVKRARGKEVKKVND